MKVQLKAGTVSDRGVLGKSERKGTQEGVNISPKIISQQWMGTVQKFFAYHTCVDLSQSDSYLKFDNENIWLSSL